MCLFVLIGFSGNPGAGKDKLKYLDTAVTAGETKLLLNDGFATPEFAKARITIENKNEYFILIDPSKCFFYANGNKVPCRDKELVVPPAGKKSRVLDVKGNGLNVDVMSLVIDGISRTGNEKIVAFPEVKAVHKEKKQFDNVEIIVADVDYDHSNKLNLRIKVVNTGNELLILNPGVIELNEQGSTLNNIRKRSSSLLLRKGESETVVVSFQTTGPKGDKSIVWNDALVAASTLPLPPMEVGMTISAPLLSNYSYFIKPEVVKPAKKEEPVVAANTKSKPEKNSSANKGGKTGKTEAAKKEAKKEEPKRSVEDDVQELHAADVNFVDPGAKFYALLIGESDYTDPNIPDLDGLPVNDALALEKVLTTYYTFDAQNVKVLKSPTRREIVIALDEMAKKATPQDNVLIFYGGHGHYEDDNDIGYWLPKDAEVSNSANWLYNDQLVASMRKIKSLHTLLISDACFSGSIFKNRSISLTGASDVIKKKYQLPSRKAMTSGTLKTVPNKSVFIKYLLDRLEKNKEKYYSSASLFQSIEQPVGNNSNSLPQFGVIQNVGDEGGDFIFIKK
ncbi:MAG: caspase family protein [Bacteroidia bacterium]